MRLPHVTSYQLTSWVVIFIGVFLFGYLLGYSAGTDQVTIATVECSSGWRGTINTLDECAHSLHDLTEQNARLAVSCERLAERSARCVP